jgi:ribosomal protein S18 acetylase RimI-like enzyme
MLAIREAMESDAAALAQMFEDFNAGYREITITPEQMAARLRACSKIETTLLAQVDGRTAGFVCVRVVPFMSEDTPYAEVSDLYVDAAFRRQGIATALLEAADTHAREQGAAEIVVLTGDDNAAAQALYRRIGYGDYAVALRKPL